MRRLELIEELSGRGTVYRKGCEPIGESAYDLRVHQEIHDASTEEVPGLRQIRGRVEGLDNFGLLATDLTLHLEDQRRLDFLIVDLDGTITVRSDIYIASER